MGDNRDMEASAPAGPVVAGYVPDSNGADALALAAVLARVNRLPLQVVSVVTARSNEQVSDEVAARIREEVAGQLAGPEGPAEFELSVEVSRSPAKHLYEAAERTGASTIVIGPAKAKSRLWRSGKVVNSLLEGAPCAVAVAPAGYAARAPEKFERVAVAFNRSDEAAAATAEAERLALASGATLTLVSVAEPVPPGYGAVVAALTASEWESKEEKEKRAALDAAVAELRERNERGGLLVEGELLGGVPGDKLAEASGRFDVFVIGSREYGPIRRTLVGSTSRALVSRSACPVLVTPRP